MIHIILDLACGICILLFIHRLYRLIRCQEAQIQKYREALALTDEALTLYKEISNKQAEQIKLLRIYAAIPQYETDCEK